jgi:ferredoxin-NADP reductase
MTPGSPGGTFWDPSRDETLVCRQIRDETHDVRTFVLSPPEPRLFAYRPGQFMTFEIPVDGVVHSRCYTLSSTPTRPHRVSITVKRTPGGPVSNWLHDHFRVGDRLNALGPMGEFTCAEEGGRDLLLLSAGSGITPLMSMARAHHDLGDRRDVVFVHSARTPADVIFADEVALMARGAGNFSATTICEDAAGGWNGFTGRLSPPMLSLIAPDFREREVFVCGPTGFMDAVRTMLADAGFDMSRHHEESFVFAALSAAEQEQAEDEAPPSAIRAHKVEFTRSKRTIDVPADTAILTAAVRAGLRLPSSCTQGVCGTCKSKLVSGQVQMTHAGGIRQREIDQGMILICCSRPITDLVIDR